MKVETGSLWREVLLLVASILFFLALVFGCRHSERLLCLDPVRSRGVRDEPAEPLGSVRRGPGDIPGGLRARDAPQRGEQVRVRVEGCRPRAVRALPHDARWREGQLPALRPRGRFQEEPPRPALLKCRRSWWLRGSALVVVVLDRLVMSKVYRFYVEDARVVSVNYVWYYVCRLGLFRDQD